MASLLSSKNDNKIKRDVNNYNEQKIEFNKSSQYIKSIEDNIH